MDYYINGFKNYIKIDDKPNDYQEGGGLNNEVVKLVNNYIKLDNAYRIKHKELMVLYNEYEKLYKKCADSGNDKDKQFYSNKIEKILQELHSNDECMYNKRLENIKAIKNNTHIDDNDKKYIAKKIVVAYRLPPVKEYQPIQTPPVYKMEKTRVDGVSHDTIDRSYIKKHNELIQVFKAYKKLYNKVGDYKVKLDKYQNLQIKSKITRDQMNKMLDDQDFMMKSIDEMQDNLISKDILNVEDKIPFEPVVGNYKNIGYFNNNMKEQITDLIKAKHEVSDEDKQQIRTILETRDDNDRDHEIRKLILFKK